jgi:hypothetical protein
MVKMTPLLNLSSINIMPTITTTDYSRADHAHNLPTNTFSHTLTTPYRVTIVIYNGYNITKHTSSEEIYRLTQLGEALMLVRDMNGFAVCVRLEQKS